MTEFPSWLDYHHFSNSVIRESRFLRKPEAERFLKTVMKTSVKRQKKLDQGNVFWRAQLGHAWRWHQQGDEKFEIPCVWPADRMKPNAEFASDGRVSPKGIPCLYLATQRDTAISEVRPWIGATVTVAQFETVKPLKIIDCASDEPREPLYMGEPEPIEREKAVWAKINKSLSEPIQNEDIQKYVPTQILTEMFKMNGLDGIAYRSNFGDKGINLALFDVHAAHLINRQLYKVKKIQITSVEDDNIVA